jgi:hypothetical protein
MNETQIIYFLSELFQSTVGFIFDMLSTELFWIFILSLMALGRWLLTRELILFSTKKENELTAIEKKNRSRLLFWGKGLLWLGAFFIIIFFILLISAKTIRI